MILSLCTVFQGAAQHTAQNAPNPENLADTAIPRINSTDGPANRLPGGENTAISDGEVSRFGRLLVQTPQGRIEPVDTYASELLRKLHHRDHYGRLTATEWLLGVLADPDRWSREPFIYLPDKSVRTLLAGAQAPGRTGLTWTRNLPRAGHRSPPQANTPHCMIFSIRRAGTGSQVQSKRPMQKLPGHATSETKSCSRPMRRSISCTACWRAVCWRCFPHRCVGTRRGTT
ncbi:MAG: hypothetical protein ACLR1G_14850 [Alistipes indistinctus]